MRFPLVDLHAQYESIREEVTEAVLRTLESQRYILGPEVTAFENEIAEWNGSRFAIGCASGTDALLLALMALEIGPGDEVITTPFTFVATVASIVRLGSKPVFVDIDPATFNLNPDKLPAAVTPRTKAILPVHLFGLPADLDRCRIPGIPLIEDAAQAIGATYHGKKVGNIGEIGCFSFFPSKNLGAAGDGGLLTTNDAHLAERLRVLANHGSRQRYRYDLVGFNSRLDSLQAAILRVKLKHLDRWAAGRRRKAQGYGSLREVAALPSTPGSSTHVFNQFTIRTPQRDELRKSLAEQGFPSEIYYPSPLHLEPAYAFLGHRKGDFPEAERAAGGVLSLPIYPELPDAVQQEIVDSVLSFFGKKTSGQFVPLPVEI